MHLQVISILGQNFVTKLSTSLFEQPAFSTPNKVEIYDKKHRLFIFTCQLFLASFTAFYLFISYLSFTFLLQQKLKQFASLGVLGSVGFTFIAIYQGEPKFYAKVRIFSKNMLNFSNVKKAASLEQNEDASQLSRACKTQQCMCC